MILTFYKNLMLTICSSCQTRNLMKNETFLLWQEVRQFSNSTHNLNHPFDKDTKQN